MSNDTQKPTTELATTKTPVLAGIQHRINAYVSKGELVFPPDFSQGNAMASAKVALITLGVIDDAGNPTGACTTVSLVNAVFDSMVQGMNVGKKQGYFINYGKVLCFQRSYFGDQALAERLMPCITVYSGYICKQDKFRPTKKMTRRGLITSVMPVYNEKGEFVSGHEMGWPRDVKEIVAAYCGAMYTDPDTGEVEDLGVELMDIDQIKTSWKKSKAIGPSSFHNEQPDIACIRTVTRRWAKPIINASNDALLMASLARQEDESIMAEVREIEDSVTKEIAQHANSEPLVTAPPTQAVEESGIAEQTPETQAEGQPALIPGEAPKEHVRTKARA